MPIFNESPDTESLTKEEKAWCKNLEKLLMKTPARFGISVVGDPWLLIFDSDEYEARDIEQEESLDGTNAGLILARIQSSEEIQGWCG